MNFWRSLSGSVRVELTSGDPAGALVAVGNAGITVFDAVRSDDDVVTRFYIHRADVRTLKELCRRKGYDLKITGLEGTYWTFRRLLNRPVLICSMLLLLSLALYLPSRVFFVHIEGNSEIPTRLILEKCADCGIYFGASREEVRSEKMKNALLEAIPELQWAGINTSGCVATVTVRERTDSDVAEQAGGVSSIIAAHDGVITQCTVIRGNRMYAVGQAVRAGDVLVSGYTDLGLCIQATHAEAEIYAQTRRDLTAVTPTTYVQEAEERESETKYALIIGKKRINFYKGSGISGITCDKIYKEKYMTLPGGFQLPVAVVTEVWTYAGETEVQVFGDTVLSEFAESYLASVMTAGTILNKSEQIIEEDGFLYLQGEYACHEMIARTRSEEIIKPYGNDN